MSGESNHSSCPEVTVVTGSLSPWAGGMFFSARKPANLMAQLGRAPHIVGLSDDRWEEARSTWEVPSINAVPSKGPRGYLSTYALISAIERGAPDLVHLRGIFGPYSLAAYLFRRRTGTPLVISPHGMVDHHALKMGGVKKRLMALAFEMRGLRNASALHALNDSEAVAMREAGLEIPVAIIPNGVEIREPFNREDQPPASRKAKRELLFLARIHSKKGCEELLRAWAMFVASNPEVASEWHLRMAGWGEGGYIESLISLAGSLGISKSVEFCGPLFDEAKFSALEEASGYILPSYSEGLPISVLEAWERSLPVMMTDACNLTEGFSKGAAICIENTPERLARDLENFCTMADDTRHAIGRRARALVEKSYDWNSATQKYLQLYDWLASDAPRPDFVEI